MIGVKVNGWEIPKNTNLASYNAWFRKEYPELFECEIKDTVESCDDCGFCDLKCRKAEGEAQR
nr:MAG TPA: 4Fe-4S binding domain protein [Caudoviricetes sp.]